VPRTEFNSRRPIAICESHIADWRRLNPSTPVVYHGNEALDEFFDNPLLGIALYRNWDMAAISDLIRFLILQKYGGFYADCDIKPIVSIEYMFNLKYTAILAQRYGFPRITTAPVAFCAKHHAIDKVFEKLNAELFEKAPTPIRGWHYENCLSKNIDETFMVLHPDCFNAKNQSNATMGIHDYSRNTFNGYYS
jgi:mannosyltransferase OCH1-like enzyme